MKYYSILDVSPTTNEWIPEYLSATNNLVKKYGGKYIVRTPDHIQLEGNREKVTLRIILEWPSKKAAQDFMSDPDYIPHLQARTKGSISNHYLVKGNDDFAQ
ncbi:DUF1330 domain-containing protein [Tenacibaculum xiamenense]|uniref:DUF1330 domain-containing protein n=1 Tax=Tenacibaculum xiamenense TaxID=1261553 RepID=UPI00389325B4